MSKCKIIHFRDACIGCGSCVETSPGNWEMNAEDGKACLKRAVQKNDVFVAEIADIEIEDNKYAAQCCPVGIIQVVNENGKDITND